jgi:hypothetical protein
MTNQHPITPPPELVASLRNSAPHGIRDAGVTREIWLIKAYPAGADQELEACCEWLECNYNYPQVNHPLRAARRPEPPSLKEQALGGAGGTAYTCLAKCTIADAIAHHPPRPGGPR